MQAASPLQLVHQALATLELPSATVEQRREASFFLEQVKRGDVHALLSVAGSLVVDAQLPANFKVVGYTLLTDLVRGRWQELSDTEKAQLSELSYRRATAVADDGREARPLKGKASVLLAAVVRQQGADAYQLVVPQLITQAAQGAPQAELACLVLHYLSEDLTFFDTAGGENKRLFLAALTNSTAAVFPFLCEALQQHFMLALQAQQQGQQADALAAHTAVIQAALGALSTWVEWVPMARVTASNVLDACTFFLTVPDFRLPALDVLKQVVGRKRTTEPWSEYGGLMDKLATQLVARAAEMGLMAPPGQLPAALSGQLDYGGDLEEVGRRLCSLVASLAECHMRALLSDERRFQILQLLLLFTAHPYLALPATTLHVWAQLLREATPGYATSTGNNAALHGLPQQALAEVMGPGYKPGTLVPLNVPPDCTQALLGVVVELLPKVVGADAAASQQAEGAANGPLSPSIPAYIDSLQDWRELCTSMRGQVKVVIRAAAQLYPDQGLALVAQMFPQAVAAASAAGLVQASTNGAAPAAATPRKVSQVALILDCAVHVIEAAVPALLEQAASRPQLLDQLVGLMQSAMAVRFTAPRLVVLHARCLEAFGRVLQRRPDLATQLVSTALQAMSSCPLSAHGQAPPPPIITREWRSTGEARLSMANAVAQVAKVAPAALAPHLRGLADQVTALWSSGQLMEGERVLLWEGLLAAAGGVSSTLAAQLVGWLLGPMSTLWTSNEWKARFASPQAFVQAFMPLEPVSDGQPGQVRLGARAERWALYHQITLLERAMRRTAPPAATSAAATTTPSEGRPQSPKPPGAAPEAASQPPQPPAEYPMDAHLAWCLPIIALIMRCVHGLAAAEAANQLGPLQGIMALDDIDKSLRVLSEDGGPGTGGRDSKEPRCVAGGNVMQDGRYFLRAMREGTSMVVSLAAAHASPAALWAREELAGALVGAATQHLEAIDHNHMRLLIRHIAIQLSSKCPPAYQPLWLLPLLRVYLPHLWQRLNTGWTALLAAGSGHGSDSVVAAAGRSSAGGAAGGTASGGAGGPHGKSKQDIDEVVGDVLLREVTREHMQLLAVLTLRPGEKLTSANHASSSTSSSKKRDGSSAGGVPDVHAAGPGEAANGLSKVHSATMLDGRQAEADSGARNTGFDLLAAHQPELAQVFITTAVSGMCWPDSESAAKAVHACRFLVTRGLQEVGMVQDAMLGPLLQAAIYSLTQVFSTGIQAELLALLRALLVGALAQSHTADRARMTLSSLLQVPGEVLARFESQLSSTGSEKEQRNIIKQLVAAAGGEEVRKVLAAVSRLPAAPVVTTSSRIPTPRKDPAQADQDAALQGAIYKAIFD